MKVVLDTNVFISGIFLSGPPFHILEAWRNGKIQLVISPEILDVYFAIISAASRRIPSAVDEPLLAHGHFVLEDQLQEFDVAEVVAGRFLQPHVERLHQAREPQLPEGRFE